jgi:hypothetical protein
MTRRIPQPIITATDALNALRTELPNLRTEGERAGILAAIEIIEQLIEDNAETGSA